MAAHAETARAWAAFARDVADANPKNPIASPLRAVAGMLNYVAASAATLR
jgi:hypothetical protein